MTFIRSGLLALMLPAVLGGQNPPSPDAPRTAPSLFGYRGFAPGAPYREFAERARARGEDRDGVAHRFRGAAPRGASEDRPRGAVRQGATPRAQHVGVVE